MPQLLLAKVGYGCRGIGLLQGQVGCCRGVGVELVLFVKVGIIEWARGGVKVAVALAGSFVVAGAKDDAVVVVVVAVAVAGSRGFR